MTVPSAAAAAAPPLAFAPLVDHHCHGLVTRDVDRATFEGMLNESVGPSPLGTTVFDSMLGLAVRRWCAPMLGLESHASPDAYLTRRRDLGVDEVNRRFMRAAGIGTFLVDTGLVDTGLDTGRLCSPDDLVALSATRLGSEGSDSSAARDISDVLHGRAREVIRLEVVGQEVLAGGAAAGDFAEQVEARLRESGAIGAKSVAAYRTGLRLPAVKPDAGAVADAVREVVAAGPESSGTYRIAHPVVNGWLAWAAIEAGLPLQFHVGYGDSDVDLLDCDPLLLTRFLRATQDHGVPVLLLHNYPFHRGAAYLAQVFEHVFMDVGLATHNTGALSDALLREALELVPFGKLLFSSDAFGLSELYLLGALRFRRGLSTVLGALVAGDEMTAQDAAYVADLVGSQNALRAYGLS